MQSNPWDANLTAIDGIGVLPRRRHRDARPEPVSLGRAGRRGVRLRVDRIPQRRVAPRIARLPGDGDGDAVPLAEFREHVTSKWWVRHNSGAAAVEHFTRLDERDRDALRAAWERYDRFDEDAIETRILTIHASKGVEAADVVVYDGSDSETWF